MNLNVLVLPGDGIGEEVTRRPCASWSASPDKFHHTLNLTEGLLGGVAIHKTRHAAPG